jgi:hypothetical protein
VATTIKGVRRMKTQIIPCFSKEINISRLTITIVNPRFDSHKGVGLRIHNYHSKKDENLLRFMFWWVNVVIRLSEI